MTITLNGKSQQLPGPLTVRELLVRLGLEGKPVVVERNQMPVFPRAHNTSRVEADAAGEIVALAAGG